MKAIRYYKKGQAKKFRFEEIEKPSPKSSEVLIKVVFVSPNAADYRSAKMGLIPKHKILGSGVSGIIDSVGTDVQNFKKGDPVLVDLADTGFGGFAEFCLAPEKAVVHLPKSLGFDAASTLPVAATTALQALKNKGGIQKGQKVLIIGSGGGVGLFAVQLAKHFGTTVSAVCSTQNLEQSRKLGADFVIDYKKEDLFDRDEKYDLILAINGNYPLLACKNMLTKTGRYVAVGGALTQIFKAMFLGNLLSLGTKKISTLQAKSNKHDLEFVAQLLAEGKIQTAIEQRFNFIETEDAMHYVSTGHARAKVVIDVNAL